MIPESGRRCAANADPGSLDERFELPGYFVDLTTKSFALLDEYTQNLYT